MSKKNSTKPIAANKGKVDIVFLGLVLTLLTVGLVMLFSASYAYSYTYYGTSYRFIVRQVAFALIGVVAMFVCSRIPYHFWKKLSWPIYAVALALLAFLLAVPPMVKGMDVKRWFAIGSFSFQPSEIAKFAIIVLFSHLISINYKQMDKFRVVAFLVILLAVPCVLVVAEPHLSATLLIFIIGVVLMIIGGLKLPYILGGLGIGVLGAVVAMLTGIVGYGSDRIKFWLDPWADPLGKGFQTIQSLLAIGSGGLMGKGLGKSIQKQLWVPEPHNDFIFSIVCEELGVIGATLIVLLFCALVWRGFTIAMKAKDKFGCFMAVGLSFQVGLQAVLNILVVTNTIPNTGISLPFFSYGGTSLVLLLAQMGIVLAISKSSNLQKV